MSAAAVALAATDDVPLVIRTAVEALELDTSERRIDREQAKEKKVFHVRNPS